MRTKIDKTYLKEVNRKNPLPSHKPDYYDYDEVEITLPNYEVSDDDYVVERGETSSVVRTFYEKNAHKAYEDLKDYLDRKGYILILNEAGRTEKKQALYRENAEKKHGHEYAENYVAKPFETEHGLGTAGDFGVYSKRINRIKNPLIKKTLQRVFKPKMYSIMHHAAVKQGFITRYPIKYVLTNERRQEIESAQQNGELIASSGDEFRKLLVQYNYEPWHMTYVGVENAEFMTKHKLVLEEYIALVNIYEQYADEFDNDEECPSLSEFYDYMTTGVLFTEDDKKSAFFSNNMYTLGK